VFVPSRGRFRVNITAAIVIRMATSDMAGIAIDLLDSFETRRTAVNIAKLPELIREPTLSKDSASEASSADAAREGADTAY
jgi:hypothetical protein